MGTQYMKFMDILKEMFQFNQADLDFGIYRIINQKRREIQRFLEDDLLPQVNQAFEHFQADDRKAMESELTKLEGQLLDLGIAPEQSPKYIELKEKLGQSTSVEAMQQEVFSHLTNFFGRYYDNGDFISLRRYKEGIYAIPYGGEEVKLHWVNANQYYVKTTEHFRDYSFKLPSGREVHFILLEADTERDNIKPDDDKNRRFMLIEDDPMVEMDDALQIRFNYTVPDKKVSQNRLNTEAVERIFRTKDFTSWKQELAIPMPTEKNKQRTLLEKRLQDYTARNTFDYFIHRDLGGFLRRELDFFIKNDVLHIDDLDVDGEQRVLEHLSKITVIKRIGHKIIDLLEQIENFQKKLWLKKKFVVETNYCLTLDRVPQELYPEILENQAQIEEWKELYAIDEIEGDLMTPGYVEGLSLEFLKAQPYLVLDTKHFSEDFKDRLLSSFHHLDENMDGLLIQSENFQALNLLQQRYGNQVKCVYIDPPYNAKSSEILYKNNFKHSSWLSLMENRLSLSKNLLREDFVNVVAIDEVEQEVLGQLLSLLFPECEKSCITIVHNATGQQGSNFSYVNEFAYFVFPRPGKFIGLENRKDNPDVRPLRNVSKGAHLRSDGANCFYPIFIKDGEIVGFGDVCPDNYHPSGINVEQPDGTIAIYPIDPQGVERKWVFARNTVESILDDLEAKYDEKKQQWDIIRTKTMFNYKTVWTGPRYSANSYGSRILNEMLPSNNFTFPKSIFTVRDCIDAAMNNAATGLVLDYFAGSGTTAHAVINLNREDDGSRKYILVEMGHYFDTVLVPRIKKVVYSKEWKRGKPVDREGISHMFKYLRLESYEDALNNIELERSALHQVALDLMSPEAKEEYMLSYMLDIESKSSASLISLDALKHPFDYKLRVTQGTETREVSVDLVETFNYIIGLKVQRMDSMEGFRTVIGELLSGDQILVIWRDLDEQSNEDLEKFFVKQGFNAHDCQFDRIYVNGDNHLETLKAKENHWKFVLIEEELKRLMFDVHDTQGVA